jgi:hypothetical protein
MCEANAGRKLLADCQSIVPKDLCREIAALAKPLRGKEYVRERFLTPRLVRDDLRILRQLLAEGS